MTRDKVVDTSQQAFACLPKMSDSIPKFDGSSSCLKWIEKYETVGRMMNWADITNFFMLYLTGNAYTVFSRMSTEDKKNWRRRFARR
ncbi:hypothetical protein Ciccas_009740 [Cichlidogyrus casuarinus]|uniref:Uncharacterized protein n=1 Tax=Cichlidogyrus casuarinus TaxID=1844966 RepID=A0ABD2Q0N6_9PLAT